MHVIATAPGKLLLLGEYAVLEGAPALVLGVDRRARVHLSPYGREGFVLGAPEIGVTRAYARLDGAGRVIWADLDAGSRARLAVVTACLEQAAALVAQRGLRLPAARLGIDTTAFRHGHGGKLGLGSSAAVCVSLLGALLARAGLAPGGGEPLLTAALEAHRRAQGGAGSGVDVAASTLGGALRFQRSGVTRLAEPLVAPAWLDPIGVWAGESTSTPAMIALVRALCDRDRNAYRARMDDLAGIAAAGCAAFAAQEADAFLAAVERYGEGLARLGEESGAPIVSPAHRRIGEVVRAAGGVYKPSGAGGGDMGMALAASAAERSRIETALIDAGIETLPIPLATSGLETRIEA